MSDRITTAADALVSALIALRKAEQAVTNALSYLRDEMPPTGPARPVGERSTSVQVLAVLSRSREPLEIGAIAEGVSAIRQDEDTPRKHGRGTRYEELCRNAVLRLIKEGVVERVPPKLKHQRMRFQKIETTGLPKRDRPIVSAKPLGKLVRRAPEPRADTRVAALSTPCISIAAEKEIAILWSDRLHRPC